jgi:hypothetical protein
VKVFCTVSFNDVRILVVSGPDGCLLVQISNSDFSVLGLLELSLGSNLLFGANNIQFVRLNAVESLRNGQVLIGSIAPLTLAINSIQIAGSTLTLTGANSFFIGVNFVLSEIMQASYSFLNGMNFQAISATSSTVTASIAYGDTPLTPLTGTASATNAGNTYETLVDLSKGQIIGTWDKSNLKNQFVNTGEFLFTANEQYSGLPSAPTLNIPVVTGASSVLLSWSQIRPDLIASYTILISNDGVNYINFMTIGSGYVEEAQLTLTTGGPYYFIVQATNLDGVSPDSNVQSVYMGVFSAPLISLISNITSGIVADGFGLDYGDDFGGVIGYQVTVSWVAQNPGPPQIASYTLQMQIDNGAFATVATIQGGTQQSYVVSLLGGHTYGFQVFATASAQNSNTPTSQVISVTLPLAVTSLTLPNGVQGQAYGALVGPLFGVQLTAMGGVFPYSWEIIGGLPNGMSVNSLGFISGVPANQGTYLFTAQVTDSATPQPFVAQILLSIAVV